MAETPKARRRRAATKPTQTARIDRELARQADMARRIADQMPQLPKGVAAQVDLPGGVARTAKLIADMNLPEGALGRIGVQGDIAARLGRIASSPLYADLAKEYQATLERSSQMTALRERQLAELAKIPSPTAVASASARATARLVELETATGQHIADMAEIASATLAQLAAMQLTAAEALEESRQLRITMGEASTEQRGSNRRLFWLTVAIVALTVVLALQALHDLRWWPFF